MSEMNAGPLEWITAEMLQRETVKMLGGFRCRLTFEEQDAWDSYLKARPEYAEARDADVEFNALYAQVIGGARDKVEDLKAADRRRNSTLDALYQVGKAWYAGLGHRR